MYIHIIPTETNTPHYTVSLVYSIGLFGGVCAAPHWVRGKSSAEKEQNHLSRSFHSKISTYVPCPQSIWYNHTWMEHYSNWNLENQLVGLSQSRSCRSVRFWNSCYSAALTQHRRCIPFLQSFIYVGGHHHKKKRSKYQITRPGIRSMETTIFKNLHTFGIDCDFY